MITSAVVKQLLSYVGIYIEYCPLDMVNTLGVQVSLLNYYQSVVWHHFYYG